MVVKEIVDVLLKYKQCHCYSSISVTLVHCEVLKTKSCIGNTFDDDSDTLGLEILYMNGQATLI